MQAVYLGPEVVAELLERGRKADRLRIDHYTIALARARTPEARDFFRSILRAPAPIDPFAHAPTGSNHLVSTRFHAAVGLAQLGDAEGVDRLIVNCQLSQGTVMNAWPQSASPGGDLSACYLAAL